MAIHADTVIAEIRNSLKQYDTSGLIDDYSLYNYIFSALRKFGNLITTKHEIIIPVRNKRATLPSNFESIQSAMKADKGWVESEIEQDHLQQTYFWKERTEKNNTWNRCQNCSKEYGEKVIVEKIYLHEKETKFCYTNPCYLRISKHTKKDLISKDCNILSNNSPYEITINDKTVHTNFEQGELFIKFYGFEVDEQGKPYIPQSPHEHLETYITYFLKRKIFEDIWLNSDDTSIEGKIQYLMMQEKAEFDYAMSDVKADSLTFKGFAKLERMNKKRTATFEYSLA